jgi:hypothetical protein
LPGFDVVHVAFSLVLLLITALCFSMTTLAIGAHARKTTTQALGSLFVILMALVGMTAFFSIMTAAGESIRFDEPETWWALSLFVFLGLSTGYICEQGAVAQLTFDSDNRSTRIRLAVGGQWLFCWIGLLTFLIVRLRPSMNADATNAILTLTVAYITLVGMLFVSEPDSLSRRVSRGLPHSRGVRVLCAPFLPGGARGLLYALVSLVVLCLFVTVLFPQLTATTILRDRQTNRYAIALTAYSLIYLGAGTCLARLLRRVMQSVYSFNVVALLGLANLLLIVATQVIHFLSRSPVTTPELIDVVNPVVTLRAIADADRGSVDAIACLVMGAAVAIAVNVTALWRGVRDVVNDPVRAQIESQPQPAGIVYRRA